MKKHICKLHYLLSILVMVAMTGCGASNSNITGSTGNGALSAKLVWGSGSVAKAAKTTALPSVPGSVAKIRMTVSGANVPVARNEVAASAPTQVNNIYPGTVSLVVQALDSSNVVLYEGFALNVVVTSNATTDVGTITMAAPIVKANEVACLQCHETTIDTTGQNLIADYKQSGHYTNMAFTDGNGVGAGCVGCHGPSHNVANPYASGRCFECHTDKVTLHFNSYTGAGRDAMYVPTNYAENCNACHQPHNTNSGNDERHAWAKSAHGEVDGVAWTHYEFQQPNRSTCQRCHTATGFKAFAASNFTAFNPASVSGATDRANEVLACDACHTDNKFTVRAGAAYTAPYTINNQPAGPGATITFPSVGESNLCLPCHAGLENGVGGVADFTNAGFVNSHYLGAAAVMYMSSGFTNFTSGSAVLGTTTYAKTLSPDNASVPGYGISGGVKSTHRNLGTAAIVGDHGITSGLLDANGPCVTCHLNAKTPSGVARAAHGHTLEIDANAYNQVCINCHTSENTVPLTAQNFKAVFIEPQSEAFQSNLQLAVTLLKNNYNIEYDAANYPYFFKGGLAHTPANAVKNWTNNTGSQVLGKKLMGACFNIQLLTKDPAAYAHARSYSRRLLYDTIDFLDDGVINLSVGTTAVNLSAQGTAQTNPLYGVFTKGTNAYNNNGLTGSAQTITTIATGTSEALLYTLGWSRSTGAWNSPERP